MGSHKQTTLVLSRESLASVVSYAQLSLVSRELDLRRDHAGWLFHVLQVRCCSRTSNFELAVVEGETEVFACLGQLVQLAGRNVVTQTVNLVVGCPDVALWSNGDTSGVTHAFGVNHRPVPSMPS